MPDTVLIFANPIAGRGQGKAIAERVAARLQRDGFDPRLVFDRLRPRAARSARRRTRGPPSRSAATAPSAASRGGCSSCSAATCRRCSSSRWAPPTCSAGTSARGGTTASCPPRVADAIQAGNIVHLDAARANDELFLLMAGVGLDAKVVHELDRIRSGPIDLTSYALPAALALGFYRYPPLTVTVDGKTRLRRPPGRRVRRQRQGVRHRLPDPAAARRRTTGCSTSACCRARTACDAIRQFLLAAAGEHLTARGDDLHQGQARPHRSRRAGPGADRRRSRRAHAARDAICCRCGCRFSCRKNG